ncbi:Leucine efflux protein [Pseudovibrio axinellae]|uniref:Leucine efflux protein n=1 Tax=Pseudovibrio axinellae TaxID=989403 RepID=A0A166AZ67_9HYPH|nr:LysE family translocator [Pseudovibrio axinellae]KZL21739.1 Leucine efflux protein [Pseudovibrio axinellae]SEQ21549.1 Threonine/homoserine/homoserine lactone efflux protein [Pseudovibrio axinellae]
MPDYSTLLIFAVASLALTATPGPDMLLIASRSAAQGRRAGLATFAGIAMGTYAHALAAALGLSQLFLAVPIAYDVVRFVGAGYLAFLAWKAFTSPPQGDTLPSKIRKHSSSQMFRQGFLTNLLNPKMVVFVLALFPQFVKPEAGNVGIQILALATVLNAVGLIINGTVIMAASRLMKSFSGSGKLKHLANYVLGTVFAGLAARLAFESQR